MTSIIEQIQHDALDPNVRVSDLLRRVKLAATKLGLGSVEDWVERELNGYRELPLPDYREVYGKPVFKHPTSQSWELIGGSVQQLSRRPIGQSIASLEEWANAPTGAAISFPFADETVEKLNERNGTYGCLAALSVDPRAFVPILDRVRNLVLDWAIKMEAAGVLGTEFSFTAADKERAQGATTTINVGSIGLLAGNLGTGNTAGDVCVRGMDVGLVRDLISQLNANLAALTAAGADGASLKARLDLIEAEMRKPAPAASILRGLLVDVRNAVAGATGNLMATGAIALINQILATGVPIPS